MSRGWMLADEAETRAAGAALASLLRPGDVVTLAGPLGAGKTSFARGLLGALGLAGEAPSPSFALVLDYRPPEVRLPLAHVDLYRLEDARELDELGLDDVAAEGALLVEWPERAGAGAWPRALALAFAAEVTGRRLTWHVPSPWDTRWPPPRR